MKQKTYIGATVLLAVLLCFNVVLEYRAEQRRVEHRLDALTAECDSVLTQCDRLQSELQRHEKMVQVRKGTQNGH